jgi:hypothetical protein
VYAAIFSLTLSTGGGWKSQIYFLCGQTAATAFRGDNFRECVLECLAGLVNAKLPSGLNEPLGLFFIGVFSAFWSW